MAERIELPLFPLNTVLFPGMYLPLHIFEPRYKEMISWCLETQQAFGVVFIKAGQAQGGPLPEPHAVGCTARIMQAEPLDGGRLNIMTVGQDRFRILSLSHDRPYLMGEVSLAPLASESEPALARAADALYPLVMEYLGILARLGKVDFDVAQVPTEPRELGYLAASLIQVQMAQKQDFLQQDRATWLLRELLVAYRREVALLALLPSESQGTFSLN